MKHRAILAATALVCVACAGDRATAPSLAAAPNRPLILVDGKVIAGASFDSLRDLPIESVEVVRGAVAVTRYGERARHGVVMISTKRER